MLISETIKKQLKDNPIILYMKGSPEAPQCGFSAAAAAALKKYNVPFSYVDVLANPRIRQGLPEVSEWPTFPQLFINSELIGGSDIVVDMDKSGTLQAALEQAVAEKEVG
jgi:monothiol glutaredoxin